MKQLIMIVLVLASIFNVPGRANKQNPEMQNTAYVQEQENQDAVQVIQLVDYKTTEITIKETRSIDDCFGSNRPSDWLAIARSEEATTKELVEVAKDCAKISTNKHYAIDIAIELCRNPKSDSKVILELGNSYYYDVRKMAALCPKADEEVLMEFAKYCAKASGYKEGVLKFANGICNNQNVTNKVLKQFKSSYFYGCIEEAAKSYYITESGLYELAERCADIRNEEAALSLAKVICDNVHCTKKIVEEIHTSPYEVVREYAAEMLDSY